MVDRTPTKQLVWHFSFAVLLAFVSADFAAVPYSMISHTYSYNICIYSPRPAQGLSTDYYLNYPYVNVWWLMGFMKSWALMKMGGKQCTRC